MSENKILYIKGLACTSCAETIEKDTQKLAGVKKAKLNFAMGVFTIESSLPLKTLQKEVQKIADLVEPGIIVAINQEEKIEEKDSSKIKNIMSIVGFGFFLLAMIGFGFFKISFNYSDYVKLSLYLLAWALIGYEIILIAARNIFRGRIFDENFLMTIATIGAFAIGEYPEAVAVMLFYRVGEYFQEKAVQRSKTSIKSLLDLKAEFARVLGPGGVTVKVDANRVKVGDLLLVRQGEKIPADGIIEEGEGYIDASSLTGEFLPEFVEVGSEVVSGTINTQGLLKIRVTKEYEDSTVARIMDLVEHASDNKSKAENFITKFARVYTPVVVFTALLLAFIPPLFFGQELSVWVYRALIFLVVSCPCALVVSVPLSFFGGVGRASRKGILIKGANYLEAVNNADTIVMDKTGTLTQGKFEVEKVLSLFGNEDDLIFKAFLLEQNSTHPIAKAIARYFKENFDVQQFKHQQFGLENFTEHAGKGLSATLELDGKKFDLLAGNINFLQDNNVENLPSDEFDDGLAVYLAEDNSYLGKILLSDRLKPQSQGIAAKLKKYGFEKIAVLTGDKEDKSKLALAGTGIEEIYGDLLPQDKYDILEKYKEQSKGNVIFVGDGINDAAVLALADIGISMGTIGSDIAVEASNIVLTNDNLESLFTLKKIAKKTRRIVVQNISFALAVKILFLGLGALGLMNVWGAVFADVGVSLIAVLNSIRVLKGRI